MRTIEERLAIVPVLMAQAKPEAWRAETATGARPQREKRILARKSAAARGVRKRRATA